MAGNLRKAMGIGSKEADLSKQTQPESEGPQVAAQAAAAAVLVPVGLAAFAVSAYIRSTLCPSLQSYSPQPLSSISTVRPQNLQQLHLHDVVQQCGVCTMCSQGLIPYLTALSVPGALMLCVGSVTKASQSTVCCCHMQADLLQLAGSGAEASGSSTAQQQCLLQHMQRSVAALSAMQCATPLIQASPA